MYITLFVLHCSSWSSDQFSWKFSVITCTVLKFFISNLYYCVFMFIVQMTRSTEQVVISDLIKLYSRVWLIYNPWVLLKKCALLLSSLVLHIRNRKPDQILPIHLSLPYSYSNTVWVWMIDHNLTHSRIILYMFSIHIMYYTSNGKTLNYLFFNYQWLKFLYKKRWNLNGLKLLPSLYIYILYSIYWIFQLIRIDTLIIVKFHSRIDCALSHLLNWMCAHRHFIIIT